MEEQIIITAGNKYIDIDAYAGIFSYKHLLKNLGYNAYAVTSANENESVSNIIKNLGFKFDNIVPNKEAKYIILDVSNPDFFDKFVNLNNIYEIIDHHTGYESYWKEKNVRNQIEFIGSICTIIYEKYIEYKKENLLDSNLCKILISGILDNTLNLTTNNTTERDKKAYFELMKIGNLDENWAKTYFESCYSQIEENLEETISSDIKIEYVSSILPEVFGQLIVLNKNVIFDNIDKVNSAFKKYEKWIFNIISLEDKKSYLLCSNNNVKNQLLQLFNVEVLNTCLILDKCMLRKEIMKKAREYDK